MCGGIKGIPARLQVYEDGKSASKGKSVLREILFTDVKYVNSEDREDKKVVTILMHKDSKCFSFYIDDSHRCTTKWFRYCGLLFTIPHYTIPEVPTENVILQQSIDHYKDFNKGVCNDFVYSYQIIYIANLTNNITNEYYLTICIVKIL